MAARAGFRKSVMGAFIVLVIVARFRNEIAFSLGQNGHASRKSSSY